MSKANTVKTNNEEIIDYDDPRYRITPFQQAAASCTGAILTSFLVTPLDVVKIRLQVQQKAAKTQTKCFLYCNGLMDHICSCSPDGPYKWYQKPGHFNGTMDAFIKISRYEGMSSLWSGLSPTLVLALPATILYFVTYEQLRWKLKDNYNKKKPPDLGKQQPYWIPLVSGASARIVSATIVSPIELIRTKMQSQRLSYLEMGHALKILVKQDGVKGLWKGLLPTLFRDVPFSAIYWLNYETIKSFWAGSDSNTPSFWLSFVAGAISGSVAATATVPFDVVKTHQQIEFGENNIYGGEKLKGKTTTDIFKEIYRNHGVRGLFAGIVPRLIKVAPACAIMISSFEYGKVFFNRLANRQFNSKQINTEKETVHQSYSTASGNISLKDTAVGSTGTAIESC